MYIHTFEVSNILTSEDYFTIQDELKSKSNNWDGHHKNKMSYYGLKDQGIIILFTRTKKKNFKRKTAIKQFMPSVQALLQLRLQDFTLPMTFLKGLKKRA